MVPLVAILIALLVAWASGSTDAPAPLFVEDLRSSLVELSRRAGPYEDVVLTLAESDRVLIEDVTDDALEGLAELDALIENAPDDPAMEGTLTLLDEAVALWAAGSDGLRNQLLRAADEPEAVGVDVVLTEALVDLFAGDRLYDTFLARHAVSEADQPIAEFPRFGFFPDGFPIGGSATQLVDMARADGSPIQLQPDVEIDQVATEPEMVLNTDGQLVVVYTDVVTVNVVVVNSGNGPSDPVDVAVELIGPGDQVLQQTATVQALEPSENTTVTFPDLPVMPGPHQLSLTLPLAAGEEQSDDNLRSFVFMVNEQTTPTTAGG